MILKLLQDAEPEERAEFLGLVASAVAEGRIKPSMLDVPDTSRPFVVFAVCDEAGRICGTVDLFNIGEGEAEIGVLMVRGPVGAGLRAAKRVLDAAFEELGLVRIKARSHDDNPRAADILRRAGFIERERDGKRTLFVLERTRER